MHFALGSSYFESKQWPEAVQSFEKAAQLDPTDSAAAHNVAAAQYNAGFYTEALRWYKEVLRLFHRGRPGPRLRRPLCRVADLANPSYCSRIDLQGDRVCARGRRAGRSRHLALSRSAAGGVSAPVDPADGPAHAARRRGAAGLAEPRQATVSRGSIAARFNRDACPRKGTSCQGAGQSTFRHRRTSARTRPCSRSTARRPRR
jgi:tetratricopeptide (TPR) repeat protein